MAGLPCCVLKAAIGHRQQKNLKKRVANEHGEGRGASRRFQRLAAAVASWLFHSSRATKLGLPIDRPIPVVAVFGLLVVRGGQVAPSGLIPADIGAGHRRKAFYP